MRTLVVSDLHLGAGARNDVARQPAQRAALVDGLRAHDVKRLVICGDGLELRELPAHAAAAHAAPLLEAAGEALGPDGEVVWLGGNHDQPLFNRWQETRRMQANAKPLGLAERVAPRNAGPIAAKLAEHTGPAKLTFNYPGVWLRDDVYATHGHYLDVHSTVPTIERLAAGAMARLLGPIPARATPDDYDALLVPLYAFFYSVAQRATDAVSGAGRRSSTRAYRALTTPGGNLVRRGALRAAFYGAVGGVNAAGLGPVEAALSPASLRRGSLTGMAEVVQRLGIQADHVIFGHTHRRGPLPSDDPAEWRTPSGTRLHNPGSWVYQSHFLGEEPLRSPYRPGGAILVKEEGAPELLQLVDADPATLAPRKTLSAPRPA